jgi:hypothetical protein
MTNALRAAVLCAIAAAGVCASSNRLIVLISDTHFGVGRDADGKWDPMEDARWAPEFTAFLNEIGRQGNGATDLVLNGDTFELWQSLKMDCIYPDAAHQDQNLGCTEQDALGRLTRVLSEHVAELRALGDFAAAGDNRLIIVPGNHDVALLFPALAKAVLAAIPAPQGRVQLLNQGFWLSPDKAIYAEHGHQIGEELNRFDGWPKPFITRNGQVYLQRPWGEQMVQKFYNDYERKYPVIDNFTEDSAGLGYAFAAEGRAASFQGGSRFFRMALFQVSMRQFARSLGGEKGQRKWDVAAARNKGGQFLLESVPEDSPERALAEQTLPGSDLGDMTDDEIRDICDLRAQMAADGKKVNTCNAASAGAAAQGKFLSPKTVMAKHLDETYKRLREAGMVSQPFEIFVYSHTHFANAGFQPLDGSGRSWNPWVVNTGAWQRVASKEQFDKIVAAKNVSVQDALKKIQLEDLPACYDAVVVTPYSDKPDFKLMGWRRAPDGKWVLGAKCR